MARDIKADCINVALYARLIELPISARVTVKGCDDGEGEGGGGGRRESRKVGHKGCLRRGKTLTLSS